MGTFSRDGYGGAILVPGVIWSYVLEGQVAAATVRAQ